LKAGGIMWKGHKKMDGRFKEIKKSPMIVLVMHEFHGTKGI